FTNTGVDNTHMQFFKDVESISVLIDPFTMDLTEFDLSGHFKEWYEKYRKEQGDNPAAQKLSQVIQTVRNTTHQFGKKSDGIHMNLVLVKSDKGYIRSGALNDENKLREMIEGEMGLEAEVRDLEQTYASLHFYAVSALKNQGIDRFTTGIMNDLNVKLKSN
ncbi:MAG: hypothetical protein K2H98_00025, partial [Duncaniella sp.]|nr:hypothetical protein [Duncaniella sp.]